MTVFEALRESKQRFESGERELAGQPYAEEEVAPSYARASGRGGYIRWDPAWTYGFNADDLLATDWMRT